MTKFSQIVCDNNVIINQKVCPVILKETCLKTPKIYHWELSTRFFQNDKVNFLRLIKITLKGKTIYQAKIFSFYLIFIFSK
jgi:hypothetical protein